MNSLIIALNVIKRSLREPGVLIMLVLMPIFGGLIASMVFSEPPAVKVGIAGQGRESAFVQTLTDSGKYSVGIFSEEELYKKVESKQVKLGVILPAEIDSELANGEMTDKIRIISNKYDENIDAFKAFVNRYAAALKSGGSLADTAKAGQKSGIEKPYMALGMVTMFMMMLVGAGMTLILSDKQEKTFMRLFCAPLREYEAVLGKLLANFALGLIQITLFMIFAMFVLGISWGVPALNVVILLVFFLITAIGLGIAVTALVRNAEVYTVFNTILAVMTCMLGGSFFSTRFLKGALKTISNFIPQKWEMEAFEKLASGATLPDIGINLLILLLFGIVFFTFGVKTLKPSARDL